MFGRRAGGGHKVGSEEDLSIRYATAIKAARLIGGLFIPEQLAPSLGPSPNKVTLKVTHLNFDKGWARVEGEEKGDSFIR